jgi:hypothetical protein
MAKRAALITLSVTLCALTAVSTAVAGTFSSPVLLPGGQGGEWQFAVNDRGEGGAVRGSEESPLFYALQGGGVASPVPLPIPRKFRLPFPSQDRSIAIDPRGRVAVGLVLDDGTEAPSNVEHGSAGCCGRAAIVSWQLGQQPPVAQVLSAKQRARAGRNHQVLEAPSIVIGPSAITALWTREEGVEGEPEAESEPEPNETQLEEAFGRVTGPLRVRRVATAPRGVSLTHLNLAPDGAPIASWVEDGDKLLSVKGFRTGALRRSKHVRRIPRLTELEGFANNGGGDPVFAYFSDFHHHTRSRLLMMRSRAGGPFGALREITLIHEAIDATLAGRGRFILAVWARALSELDEGHLYVQRGSVFGRFGRAQALGVGSQAHAFVDSRGDSVIVYRRLVPHNPSAHEIVAVTAAPGHRFSAPQPLAPNLRGCDSINGSEIRSPPIATSPDGHAAFYIPCEEGVHQYLIRYTP